MGVRKFGDYYFDPKVGTHFMCQEEMDNYPILTWYPSVEQALTWGWKASYRWIFLYQYVFSATRFMGL